MQNRIGGGGHAPAVAVSALRLLNTVVSILLHACRAVGTYLEVGGGGNMGVFRDLF